MEPETPAAPPEARLIRTAREAAGMTAVQAAQATEGGVSATYWRDVERGYGGRRGQRAPARASDRLLAAMAHVTGVTPDQLAGAKREAAARVLMEILRREADPRADTPPLRSVPAVPAARGVEEVAQEILDGILPRFPDDDAVQAIGVRPGWRTPKRVVEILRILGDRELSQEVLSGLTARYPDDSVVGAIGVLQARKNPAVRVSEVFAWLTWQESDPELSASDNGMTGLVPVILSEI